MKEEYLLHSGILGMKWGIRRYQNKDGTLTEEGKKRYYNSDGSLTNHGRKWEYENRKKRLEHPELLTKEELDKELSRLKTESEIKKYTEKKSKKQLKLEKEIAMLDLEVKKKDLVAKKKGKDPKKKSLPTVGEMIESSLNKNAQKYIGQYITKKSEDFAYFLSNGRKPHPEDPLQPAPAKEEKKEKKDTK